MTDITYSSNNSGGSWWLADENWRALEAAGWTVHWSDERWLGALATSATKENTTMREAISEWENTTGLVASELGCYSCCGPPHSFHNEDYSEYYSPEAPMYGDDYY